MIAADVAEGLSYGDYSSAHVIDATSGDVVAHWHGRIEPDLFENESAIESLPSGSDPARGESVYLVIVEEWALS